MPLMYETYQEVVAAKKQVIFSSLYVAKLTKSNSLGWQISPIVGIGLHVYIWAFVLIWNWFGSAGSDCRQDIQK